VAERPCGLDGILVVAKEPGYTSHDVVALVRRLTGTRRAGHGGTLDPFASGVLPVFLGLATRLVEYHMADAKAYRATVCLGSRSETDDRDGEIVAGGGPAPSQEAFGAALAWFRGPIEQRPPAYSALKVGGRRAYDLARQGTPAELKPRAVTIHRLEMVSWDATDPERPAAAVEVECSAGTYIRSLARDLGERLGCGAYLGSLARTASGSFRLAEAHSLDELRAAAEAGPSALASLLLPVDAGLDAIPETALTAGEVVATAKGQQVRPEQRPLLAQSAHVRLVAPGGSLVGIGRWQGGRLIPEKILIGVQGAPERRPVPPPPASEPRLKTLAPVRRMSAVAGVSSLRRDFGRLYVAVGVFDGLHRGHLYLLRELRRAALRAGARAAVITFDAHPEELIEGLAPPLLCDPEERLVRLAAAGVEVAVVQHFDHALRMTSYEDFVGLIRDRVDLAGFVMTPDASFGYDRGGTPETLAELGLRLGFGVTVVPAFLSNGEQLRSSEIRRRLEAGDLIRARQLLGRPLSLTGRLGPAAEGGGIPLAFDLPVCLPPEGRYPVLVGPSWSLQGGHEPAKSPGVAVIGKSGVVVEGAHFTTGATVRMVFLDGPAADHPA
jgi:tRNA pseudouridine55 synthase